MVLGPDSTTNPALANAGVTASAAVSSEGGALKPGGIQADSTAPKFGDILQKIQAQYGAKAEKPREIKKTLGKDDFLKIMITQMKHQDPTNPFKAEQMAAEMAQFASVEQLQNINQNVSKLSMQNQPLERLAMTNLIGKTITVDRDRFAHVEGTNDPVSFNLPKDASKVKIALITEQGETILEKDLGPMKAGENTFAWDGLKSNTLPAKSGTYLLRVEPRDQNDALIQTNPQARARVVGVSFEGAEPILLIGDAKHQDKITLKNVIRIESDLSPEAAGSAAPGGIAAVPPAPGGIAAVPPAPGGPNFFAFQKGVGSSNLDPAKAAPEAAQALAKFAAPKVAAADAEKGFPNGLHDSDEKSAGGSISDKLGEEAPTKAAHDSSPASASAQPKTKAGTGGT